jgi:hypothetical protein
MTAKLIRRVAASCMLYAVAVATAMAQQPTSTSSTVFIQMLPRGMNPPQLTVPHGQVTFLVQNRSSAPNVTLSLSQSGVAGAASATALNNTSGVSSVSLLPHQHHSVQTYNLSPGTYILSESHHTTWSCTITVQ